MPKPDPIPALRRSTWDRFRRMMRWMGLASVLAAAAAVYFVSRGEPDFKVHMLIATALGAGLSVFLGTALMTLTFLSSGSGHDDEAHRSADETLAKEDEF